MKTYLCLATCLATLCSAFAQPPQPPLAPAVPLPPGYKAPTPYPAPGDPSFSARINQLISRAARTSSTGEEAKFTPFSLDFPGGNPKQLVAAIETASGHPLNAIVAEQHTNVKMPPLKLATVTVPELFAALVKLSYKFDASRNVISSYGFETDSDFPTEDSIWRFFSYDAPQANPGALTRFNLDFPGGTPQQLANAIEKSTGKPLNVVIPAENADTQLPPLKMNDVNVSVLFQALTSASRKTVAYTTGTYGGLGNTSYQQMITAYGFKTEGTPSDTSIWYFYMEKPNLPPLISTAKASRFYSLAPYLERGLTVDDITTAIQTAWKMLGDKDTAVSFHKDTPTISFHKETKLLIAVGEPTKLQTIDAVLEALNRNVSKPAPIPVAAPKPAPSEQPKPTN